MTMLWIHGRYGGLCNRLFTFANLIAFGREHGIPVVNPGWDDRRALFPAFGDDPWCAWPAGSGPRGLGWMGPRVARVPDLVRRAWPACHVQIGERGVLDLADEDDPRVIRMKKHFTVCSGLYFLAGGAMQRQRQELREVFRPAPDVQARVDAAIRQARAAGDVLVGVHIRQGDYRTFIGGALFYASTVYALRMRELAERLAGRTPCFLVCSDEPQPDALFGGLPTVRGPGDAAGDLYALAACDYVFGPPSTFTQWASYYGGVPQWTLDDHQREQRGLPRRAIAPEAFRVHKAGFGAYSAEATAA